MGRQQGISTDKILSLSDYRSHPDFSAHERLSLELADAMTLSPSSLKADSHCAVQVPETLFIALRDAFGLEGTIELAAAIAWENFRARFNRCFEVASDGFSESGMCALPVVSPNSSMLK